MMGEHRGLADEEAATEVINERCPACGQIIPPAIKLGPVKRRIYRELLIQSCSAQWLRNRIGGRARSASNIYVHIMQLKERCVRTGSPSNLSGAAPIAWCRSNERAAEEMPAAAGQARPPAAPAAGRFHHLRRGSEAGDGLPRAIM